MNGPWSSILRGAYTKQTKKKKIKCELCYRSFTNEGNLVNHMNTHKKFSNPFHSKALVFPEINEEKMNEPLEQEREEDIRIKIPKVSLPKVVGKRRSKTLVYRKNSKKAKFSFLPLK